MAIDKLSGNSFATGAIANSLGYTPLSATTPSAVANSSANVIYFAANGNIGIANSTPAQKLDVNGSVKINNGVYSDGDLIIDAVFSTMIKKSGSTNATINQFGIGLAGSNLSSGTGIAFPATQNASSDANTLDDYEEGSFTPIFVASGGTPPSSQTGSGAYIKVGRVVHLHGQINWSGSGSGGSNLYVSLPFICVSGARGALALGIVSGFNWSGGHQLTLLPELNSSVAYFLSKDPAGGNHVHRSYSDVSTTGSYLFSFAGSYVTSN